MRLVGDLFAVDGEVLPLDSGWFPAFVYHPLGADNVLDETATTIVRGSKEVALAQVPRRFWRHSHLRRIAFEPEHVRGRAVVGAFVFSPWVFFLTEPAAERVRAEGLRGITLEVVWEDETPIQPFWPPRSALPALSPPVTWSGAGGPLAKVLIEGRSSADRSFLWSLPTATAPGAWMHTDGPAEPGARGLHLLTEDPWRTWPCWGMRAYAAEAGPGAVEAHGLVAASAVRLLAELEPPPWWSEGVRFIEEILPSVRWFDPQASPRAEWCLFVATSKNCSRRVLRWMPRNRLSEQSRMWRCTPMTCLL